eukprot:CAMPEP_0202726860 /NCGR_PEP_ID=MMETSP1385-20130828/184827_1 /ASSEMBLY_ACC=CAM_ASM_000861 /TAXON_ID=933848 /ORGANISM="Elphidium margaritaceum" /LENGTH=977 /DNA_ID=CAMNT_0049393089 /DNA_START=355 /DNA_END=3286 /DNA_ORIENTATION=+
MLRSKIQRNLHEVPRDHHDGLYSMLMKALTMFNDKSAEYENVRTQLSIAVALLVIQRTDWTQHVRLIIDALAQTQTLDILLNLLTRLPEELYTFNIPVSPKIRDHARTNLRAHSAYVLKLLHDLFRAVQSNSLSENMNVKLKVLKCFAAWLDFMDDHFYEYITNYTILTKLCFDALQNDALFKDACACISQILRLNGNAPSKFEDDDDDDDDVVHSHVDPTKPSANNTNDDDVHSHVDPTKPSANNTNNNNSSNECEAATRQHSQFLLHNIIALKPMYDTAVKNNDSHKCYGLTRLFVHTAETNVAWMLNATGNKEAAQLINIVLDCAKHDDAETACYVCYFWSRLLAPFKTLSKEFHRQHCYASSSRGNGGGALATIWDGYPRPWPSWCKPYVSEQQGLIAALLPILVNAAKLPHEYEEMDRDEQEETDDVRWQVPENIADICCVLSADMVLRTLSRLLAAYCSGGDGSVKQLSIAKVYECEAILFCIESTPSDALPEYQAVLHTIFAQICQLSTRHCAVRRAAMRVIAYHCAVLNGTEAMFGNLCTYVLSGLGETALQTESVRALLDMCHKFVRSLSSTQTATQLTQLLLRVYEEKSVALRAKDELMLLEAVTVLLDRDDGHGDDARLDIGECVQRLLLKHRRVLHALLTVADASQRQQTQHRDALYHAMNCVSCVFKHLVVVRHAHDDDDTADVSGALLRELWPELRFILLHYSEHEGIMEKTTRVIKHVMRNSCSDGGSNWFAQQREFAMEVLQLMTDLYCERCPQSSFLYIVWTFVDECMHSQQQEQQQMLMTSLVRIARCTLQALDSEESFRERPYIVEDFYELFVLFLRKSPQPLLADDALMQRVFERAMDGLNLDHKSAHNAVCNFYREVLYFADTHQNVARLFESFSAALVYKMLYGIAGNVKYERAQTLADCLSKLYKFDRKLIQECMRNAVQRINIASLDPNPAEFLEFFLSADGKHQRINACLDW